MGKHDQNNGQSGFRLFLGAGSWLTAAEIPEGALAFPGMQSACLSDLSGQRQSLGQEFAWQWMS